MDASAARPRCQGRFSGPEEGRACATPARFEIGRYVDFPLPVCPHHLGPSLLLARNVLWPPEIKLIG
ncbi:MULTISPECIES: hypothetical protein [unclassified Streptomyces]|uniref:hypothetical protein n=1 Tax=unclassified Streptomyces TaxID=2593676 RepID=UPI0036EE409E